MIKLSHAIRDNISNGMLAYQLLMLALIIGHSPTPRWNGSGIEVAWRIPGLCETLFLASPVVHISQTSLGTLALYNRRSGTKLENTSLSTDVY